MGGKVIKINLVGAILTIILIIIAIVGVVVFINRPKEEKKGKEDKVKIQEDINNNENYNELDTSDFAVINNEKKELLMRNYISKNGYRIDYDVNTFYVDEKNDYIKSLVSDSINIRVMRLDEDYNELVTVLNTNKDRMKTQYEAFDYKETSIGNKSAIIQQFTNEDRIERSYYIQTSKGFIEIRAVCGKEFATATFPIIDKMVASVEIM